MSAKPLLQIIVASTRPGRVGLPVANWLADVARTHDGFDVEIVDLAELDLPFFDEPNHPRLRQYVHQHTIDWSRIVERGDAYVFVTPEYNHSFNAVLKNALDYLSHEWAYKPAGIVSYGGVAAGTRAVQALKPVLAALKLGVVADSVNIPFVFGDIADGVYSPNELVEAGAKAMLDEMRRLSGPLATLREQPAAAG
ncbi:NADPH-dependent FMN reductase [Nostocoides japonicum]|uniref:NADPH-dependent FMN reductase n=1 Tax=Nostocoides japonicum TaxID=99481 RepID=UPI00065B9F5E|nr:NAD(P)H-dependent oxidoreductase [Tetrasphaera japonica]